MVLLGRKPLIVWTLEACRYWDGARIIVATDSAEITAQAENFNAEIYPLSDEDLQDKRTVSQLWQAFVQDQTGIQILMHVTSPFRFISEMEDSWKMYHQGNYDILMTVAEERRALLGPDARPIVDFDEDRMSQLTQNRKPKYLDDGGWYIADAEYIKRCRTFEDGKVGLFPVNAVARIDIDDPIDLEIARCIAFAKPNWWVDQLDFISL